MCERLRINRPSLVLDELERPGGGPAGLLAGLPARQRRAVSARVLEDQSYREIADAERVSEQVIRKRVSRALRALRARIEEER